MEPHLLIASLCEHVPATGQHNILPEEGANHGFDTAGVIIALLAMVGIMLAVAMMGGESSAPMPPAPMPPPISVR
jgi:hypothetical protein